MATIINAGTTALTVTPDTSGALTLQANGTPVATATSSGFTSFTPATSIITNGTAVASTSGTSIDFTSLPNWIKRITVMFNQVSTSGTAYKFIRLGTSGGIVSSGYG